MDAKERERLENCCRMCREDMNCTGEQLLLIRLEDVEEYLRLEGAMRDMLSVMDRIEGLRKTLKSEVGEADGRKEDSGEKETGS